MDSPILPSLLHALALPLFRSFSGSWGKLWGSLGVGNKLGSLGRDLVVPYYTIVVSIFFSSIPIVPNIPIIPNVPIKYHYESIRNLKLFKPTLNFQSKVSVSSFD